MLLDLIKGVFAKLASDIYKGLHSHNAVAKKSKFPRQADPSRLPPCDEDGEELHVVIGSGDKYVCTLCTSRHEEARLNSSRSA